MRHNIRILFQYFRWIGHPVTIFVSLQLVWLAITLIWVIWFVGQQEAIASLAKKFGQEFFDARVSLTILVVGCILLGVMCVGLILLFVFGQRQSYLARQQRTFVSSVTHELKSPLASLQLSFETMIQRKLDTSTQAHLLQMVLRDIDRLRRLVDQILVAGRLDRGLPQMDIMEEINFNDLIREIIPSYSHLSPQISERVAIECDLQLIVILPKVVINLILGNLIENALKYSPKQSIITIRAGLSGQKFYFSVKDQGIGLNSQERRRIFRMFHRGEMAVQKAIPGTGLGLYIVKQAVKSLNGSVSVESPGINQGSTFNISLPIRGSIGK